MGKRDKGPLCASGNGVGSDSGGEGLDREKDIAGFMVDQFLDLNGKVVELKKGWLVCDVIMTPL